MSGVATNRSSFSIHEVRPAQGYQMKSKFYRKLNFKITLGIVATLAIILSISSYLLYKYQREQWIDSLKTYTTNLSTLVNTSLRYAMLTNHRELIESTIQKLGREESLRDIMIFDKKGTIKFASDPVMVGITITKKEETCMVCHRLKPENRANTIIYNTPTGEKVFRNVNPIDNTSECHRCHNPAEELNGVLIMDFSMASINQALSANVNKVLLWTVTVIGIMSVVLWLLLNRMVIRRLFNFLKHTQRVGKGELDITVDETGSDEMAELARNFNRMTEDLKEYIKIKEVKLQKEQLERLVNSINEGVLVVDSEDRVVAANQAVASLLGRPGEELAGEDCCSLFGVDDKLSEECLARETFRTDTLHKTIRTFRDRSGRERDLEFYASPIRDGSGKVTQVVEVIRDITERKKLEGELLHSERLASLGMLASGVSHEIKNPLASIVTCIEGLQRMLKNSRSSLEPEELNKFNKYLALSKKEAERCKVITDKLLILSRRSLPSTGATDVNTCLSETISLLEFEAKRCNIEVEQKLDPSLPLLKANESDLREVFFNVVLNSIQAMEENGGRLSALTDFRDEYIEVTISDTGHGIEKEDMSKIFEPFFTRKPPGRGTGLGLSICSNIMKQMGGDISVRSVPGRGAEFSLRFPVNARTAFTEERAL
jgi:PAS domain S-box-containing protein